MTAVKKKDLTKKGKELYNALPEDDGRKASWVPEEDGPLVTIKMVLPHHEQQLNDFLKAGDMKSLLWDLLNSIRNCIKHGADFDGFPMRGTSVTEMSPDESGAFVEESTKDLFGHDLEPINPDRVDTLEKVRDWIREEANSRGINLDS